MTGVTPGDASALAAKLKQTAAALAERNDDQQALAARVDSLIAAAFSRVPINPLGGIDAAQWEQLSADEQMERYQEMLRVRDAIDVLTATDGPANPRSLMYREFVSNFGVILLALFALIGTLLNLYFIYANWQRATERVCAGSPCTTTVANGVAPGPLEQDVLLMVMIMGSLGGFIHMTSSVTKYIGNRQLLRSWVIYYLLMPLEGAGLAVTVYLMVRVGVLNPAASNESATKNLNWVGVYALSALAGLFSKQALEMLGDVFNTIFRRPPSKDAASKPG